MSQEVPIKDCMGLIQPLLENRPAHLTPEEEAWVEALAHKIDVVKKVVRSYDDGWKKPVDGTPLNDKEIETLVMMFLFAAGTEDGDGGDDTGKRLKWLNSAFNTLDLASGAGMDASRVSAFRDSASNQLKALLSA